MAWQVQVAKQRFSELIERARSEGPQTVTRHGRPVAVVVEVEEFRRLTAGQRDLKAHLIDGPSFEGLDLDRPRDMGRPADL